VSGLRNFVRSARSAKEGRARRESGAAPGSPSRAPRPDIQDYPEQRQALQNAAETELRDFGTRFIIFPNPVYGSWVKNPWE
jgi:hypothetical protein